jgi:hypothetical protein
MPLSDSLSTGTDYMNIALLKHAIRRLSLGQLIKLDEWQHELIRTAEEADRVVKPSPRRQPVVEQTLGNKTYRLESVRCGKEKCKCARGKLHGPYWYSYTRIKDKVKSQYIGKRLPKDVESKLKGRTES